MKYFWRNRTSQNYGPFLSCFLAWCWAWCWETNRTRSSLTHLRLPLSQNMLTFYQLLNFFSVFRKSKCDKRVLKLLHTQWTLAFAVQGVEVLSQLLQGLVRKIDPFALSMPLQPLSLLIGWDKIWGRSAECPVLQVFFWRLLWNHGKFAVHLLLPNYYLF